MVPMPRSRVAAWTATAMLVVIAGFDFYWGAGGTWAAGTSGGTTTSERIAVVVVGLVALAAAGLLLVRVGYRRGPVPHAVVRLTGTFGLVALGGAVAQYSTGGFLAGTINLAVALLVFVVARSDVPAAPAGGRPAAPSR